MQYEQRTEHVTVNCSAICTICGKQITPETGMSVARRWFVCNEHVPMLQNIIVTSGQTAVNALDQYLQRKSPKLRSVLNMAIRAAHQFHSQKD